MIPDVSYKEAHPYMGFIGLRFSASWQSLPGVYLGPCVELDFNPLTPHVSYNGRPVWGDDMLSAHFGASWGSPSDS